MALVINSASDYNNEKQMANIVLLNLLFLMFLLNQPDDMLGVKLHQIYM